MRHALPKVSDSSLKIRHSKQYHLYLEHSFSNLMLLTFWGYLFVIGGRTVLHTAGFLATSLDSIYQIPVASPTLSCNNQ